MEGPARAALAVNLVYPAKLDRSGPNATLYEINTMLDILAVLDGGGLYENGQSVSCWSIAPSLSVIVRGKLLKLVASGTGTAQFCCLDFATLIFSLTMWLKESILFRRA